MQPQVTRPIGELDQLWQERGVPRHDVVGVVDDDDQSRNRVHVVGAAHGRAIGWVLLGWVIVGQADSVVLGQHTGPPGDLRLQGAQ